MAPRTLAAATLVLFLAASAFGAEASPPKTPAFTFAVVADTQPSDSSRPWYEVNDTLPCLVNELNQLSPDFLALAGDVIAGGAKDEADVVKMWDYFDAASARLTIPVRRAPGNHDIWDAQSRRIYTQRYGPAYYSLDHKGCHFVFLDCLSSAGDDVFDPEQRAWLEKNLKKHKRAQHTFVFMHIPLWLEKAAWVKDIHPLFARYGVDYVFAGHHHHYVEYGPMDGVHYTVTGGGGGPMANENELAGNLHHYNLITVRGDEVHRAVVRLGSVFPPDLSTAESLNGAVQMEAALTFDPVDVAELTRKGRVTLTKNVPNSSEQPVHVSYRWLLPERDAWRVVPNQLDLDIAPGDSANVSFDLLCTKEPGPAAPGYITELSKGSLKCGPTQRELKLMQRYPCLPQAGAKLVGPGLSIEQLALGVAPDGPADCQARAWVTHDDANLRFRIKVMDENLTVGNEKDPLSCDFVAVAVYKDAPSKETAQFWTQCVVVRPQDKQKVAQFQPEAPGLKGTATRTADGYEVDITIPYAAANLTGAKPGDAFQCEIAVGDIDTEAVYPTVLQWHGPVMFITGPKEYGLMEIR